MILILSFYSPVLEEWGNERGVALREREREACSTGRELRLSFTPRETYKKREEGTLFGGDDGDCGDRRASVSWRKKKEREKERTRGERFPLVKGKREHEKRAGEERERERTDRGCGERDRQEMRGEERKKAVARLRRERLAERGP